MPAKECPVCGQTFSVCPAVIKQGNGKFCSRECAGLAQRRIVTLKCPGCGKEFQRKPSDATRYPTAFCSKQCANARQKPAITRECLVCGKSFHLSPHEIKIRKGLWCSRACADLGRAETLEQRFWRQVQKTNSCWLWVGLKNRRGYGKTWSSRKGAKTLIAHRVSWEIHNGAIPPGLFVCHHCDNPTCVNPEHLYLGTPADNMRDMVAKGRAARGTANGNAVVNETIVRQIRAVHASGTMGQQQIAQQFGISQSTVARIILKKSWRHVV